MTSHVHDDLPQLLRGEASRETVLEAAAHLRECEDCRVELISAVTAHASLSATSRTLPPASLETLSLETLSLAGSAESVAQGDPAPLPDLSALFEQVRREAAEADAADVSVLAEEVATNEQAPSRLQVRRRGGAWLVAAAVIGVLVGVGGAVVVQRFNDQHLHKRSSTSQTVQLAAYDTGTVPASATLVDDDQLRLDAAALPDPGDGKLYEVWLTNSTRTQLYAVGSLGSDRAGSFTVASGLVHEYSAIEVSVQPLTNSAYSGVSVLRGSYS